MELRQLGDYRLLQNLGDHPGHSTWLAEQTSIRRQVVIVELTDLSQRDGFLAHIRAKAAVEHPAIGSVYEAVSDESQCYAALEHIGSWSLADHLRDRRTLSPAKLAHALRLTAEGMIAFSSAATEPLTPAAIHLDDHGGIRLENIAIDGSHDDDSEASDVRRLGEALPDLIEAGAPGAGRLQTVLSWMRGEGVEVPLTWEQVRTYCQQVENQLSEDSPDAATSPRTARMTRKKSALPALLGGLVALIGLGFGGFLLTRGTPASPAEPEPSLPDPIAIASGAYPTPDGDTTQLAAYRLAATEITIGEYSDFLGVLAELPLEDRDVFDDKAQPAEKTDHAPDAWPAMLSAARENGTWQGRPISLSCPVVNVDWWDAAAYCRWKGGRMPDQNEWFAAIGNPAELRPAPWGPVTKTAASDISTTGLRGMAGSVSEWTQAPALNPANPAGKPEHVIIGGSHLSPRSGATTREWTSDLLMRRADLGFRILYPAEKP